MKHKNIHFSEYIQENEGFHKKTNTIYVKIVWSQFPSHHFHCKLLPGLTTIIPTVDLTFSA